MNKVGKVIIGGVAATVGLISGLCVLSIIEEKRELKYYEDLKNKTYNNDLIGLHEIISNYQDVYGQCPCTVLQGLANDIEEFKNIYGKVKFLRYSEGVVGDTIYIQPEDSDTEIRVYLDEDGILM